MGANESELESDAGPLLSTLPPRNTAAAPLDDDSADAQQPKAVAAPVQVEARAQLDLAGDLDIVRRALRQSTRFDEAALTAMATLLEAEQRDRTPELAAAVQDLVDDFLEIARERITPAFLPAALQFASRFDSKRARRFRAGPELLSLIEVAREREAQLAEAEAILQSAALSTRRLRRALDGLRAVLDSEPGNLRAQRGIEQIERALVDRALALAKDADFVRAEAVMAEAAAVREHSTVVADARLQLRTERLKAEATDLALFDTQVNAAEYGMAEATVLRLESLPIEAERVREMRERLALARLYGTRRPGESFVDAMADGGFSGPRMRVLPVGRFRMGSPESEVGRNASEGPPRSVRVPRGIAMGQSEITVADFRAFVEATGYRTDAENAGSSSAYQERSGRVARTRAINWRHNYKGDSAKDKLPVVHVSFHDAHAYAAWLSAQTGARYRLPTEAEFEYALRAGSNTPYWWGEGAPVRVVENLTGARDRSRSKREWNIAFANYGDGYWGPAPVRSFQPNGFGLYDMGGNVSEWVEDCWHDSYARAPEDSSAWVNPGCTRRVLRGGSWGSPPDQVRSAFRQSVAPENRGGRFGFRLVREL